MSDFILAVGRILPPEDHPGLSPARGSTTLRIQATLEQLIELTDIDELFGMYKVGVIKLSQSMMRSSGRRGDESSVKQDQR